MNRKPAVLLFALLALAACRTDRQGPTDSDGSQPDGPSGNLTSQEPLFTIVLSPTLTSAQAGVLSRIRTRRSSAEVHVGLVRSAPSLVLQRGGAVLIQVSPVERFVAVGEQVVQHQAGVLSWAGPLQNAQGWVQLVLTGKGVTGTLRTATELYRFEPIGGGLHALVRVGNLPPEHPPENPTGAILPPSEVPSESAVVGRTNLATQSVPTTIDVLVVYTPAAAAAVTDVPGLIQQAINETNTSYANSGVNALLRSVYSAEVSYTEAGRTYQQHVAALQSTSDGMMDVVHTWRNQYAADVVVLLVNDDAFCGLASQILATATTAFAVVDADDCATGYYSFGHEIGHLQGARHDRFVDNSSSPYAHGHGFVDPLNYNWRTIMAYDTSCVFHAGHHCSRVQYWSNPNVTYPPTGQAMGTTTYEHDARVLDDTKITVANFRSSLIASWTGPSYVGHNDTCPWTATISGGTPPYSYSWYASWTTSSTGFFFTSGQGTANPSSWGYYYGSYPNPTLINVYLSGSDAAGEQYSLQRSVQLQNSPFGCY